MHLVLSKEQPDAAEGGSGVQRVLIDTLGFSARESVCLLGGHTLGGARTQNSGYSGQWTKNPDQFDNKYYSELKDHLWKRATVSQSGKVQYNEPGVPGHFMLFTDIDMFWENAGQCDVTANHQNSCPLGPFSNLVDMYANDNDLFMSDFANTFQKLCEMTSDNLHNVQ